MSDIHTSYKYNTYDPDSAVLKTITSGNLNSYYSSISGSANTAFGNTNSMGGFQNPNPMNHNPMTISSMKVEMERLAKVREEERQVKLHKDINRLTILQRIDIFFAIVYAAIAFGGTFTLSTNDTAITTTVKVLVLCCSIVLSILAFKNYKHTGNEVDDLIIEEL